MNKLMKPSGVAFDFEMFEKGAVGVSAMILTPTLHLSMGGDFTLYCIEHPKNYCHVRFSKQGTKVGIELLRQSAHNSYALRDRNSNLTGKMRQLPNFIELEKALGTLFYSGNFPLYQESEDIWWFDLTEATSKNKPPKKKL